MFCRLSALGDEELNSISKVVNSAFSPQVFASDDQSGRTKHAFAEYHDPTKKAAKHFWDHADFVCYDDKQGYATWGARNC
mmetsp:Transcript_1732/g.4110  ORF Transcript_1732/g.4110 Transcript_1732/m.4110 type:complete len:80 (+) Transcript_1732:30-269(+)|eukprot:CAMPEP_0206251136 /NCGR_PEP_ID=MMETSP0047_2-20121206/21859_1 /ASSEMBLY_ACC=CAM_ASM_000192 /TAXON_ID=195065 /ORGANISM="Chroomonas mesostigmatica_cf, Strain CCMP1168" /LENGTH=79 /DNA_ID=CAMNT_0053677061 /DNA_START=36 /DNA_END=275 /DNA_ORIENTATION=-